jgi:hypothetical protein
MNEREEFENPLYTIDLDLLNAAIQASRAALLEENARLRELLRAAREEVVDCLNEALPHAGYARYDRRIAYYQDELAAIDAALNERASKQAKAAD